MHNDNGLPASVIAGTLDASMMRHRQLILCGPLVLALLCPAAYGQAGAAKSAAKPDFSGVWQSLNSATWDIQDHSGQLGTPPGVGIVEGNDIPYQAWAEAKKRENFTNRKTADPTEANCFLPGVPRANYMPHPFKIVQTPKMVAMTYEFAHASRAIPMDGSPHPDGIPDTWMGDSRGRWEGNTLVVDVRNFNDQTWFDHAGNFHSEALHVVERYSKTDASHLRYEATIEDAKVFTKPWKIGMPLYKRTEPNVRLLEYECVFYLQEERFRNAPFKGGAK
jgi:hypothetical protein